jgi:hypothetical protein
MSAKIPPTAPSAPPSRYSIPALPPYRFIPGINAHPVRDPEGHSYGEEHSPLKFIDPKNWRQNEEYLFGVDLYNNVYWWESHEAWENVWHTTDKQAAYGQFLQGLIQISAAFIKWHLNQYDGMQRLYEIGFGRLQFVAGLHDTFMGVDLVSHLAAVEKHFAPMIAQPPSVWSDPLQNYPFLILQP